MWTGKRGAQALVGFRLGATLAVGAWFMGWGCCWWLSLRSVAADGKLSVHQDWLKITGQLPTWRKSKQSSLLESGGLLSSFLSHAWENWGLGRRVTVHPRVMHWLSGMLKSYLWAIQSMCFYKYMSSVVLLLCTFVRSCLPCSPLPGPSSPSLPPRPSSQTLIPIHSLPTWQSPSL